MNALWLLLLAFPLFLLLGSILGIRAWLNTHQLRQEIQHLHNRLARYENQGAGKLRLAHSRPNHHRKAQRLPLHQSPKILPT